MVNNVVLVGRLTKDVELRSTTSGKQVATFTLAIDRPFQKEGEQRQADFIPVIAWNKTGEFASNYFRKGLQVSVVGRLQTRTWEDNGVKRYATEVIASEVGFADGKKDEKPVQEENNYSTITDNDLPF